MNIAKAAKSEIFVRRAKQSVNIGLKADVAIANANQTCIKKQLCKQLCLSEFKSDLTVYSL